MPWLPGFQYRRRVRIVNNANVNIYNYNVFVSMNTDDLQGAKLDGRDIRFTDETGIIKLKYFLEIFDPFNYTQPAYFWVQIPFLKANSEYYIYLYYGAIEEVKSESTTDIFIAFYSFKGNSIDTNDWQIIDSTGFSITNNMLRLTNTRGRIQSVRSFSPPFQVKTRFMVNSLPANGYQVLGFFVDSNNCVGYLRHPSQDYYRNDGSWIGLGKEAYCSLDPLDPNLCSPDKQAFLKVVGNNVKLLVQDYYFFLDTTYHNVSFTNNINNEKITLGRRYDDAFQDQSMNAYWNWILVTPYIDPEPQVTDISGEEYLPVSKTFEIPYIEKQSAFKKRTFILQEVSEKITTGQRNRWLFEKNTDLDLVSTDNIRTDLQDITLSDDFVLISNISNTTEQRWFGLFFPFFLPLNIKENVFLEQYYLKGDIKFVIKVGLIGDGVNTIYLTKIKHHIAIADLNIFPISITLLKSQTFNVSDLNNNSTTEKVVSLVNYMVDVGEVITPKSLSFQYSDKIWRLGWFCEVFGYVSGGNTHKFKFYFTKGKVETYLQGFLGVII